MKESLSVLAPVPISNSILISSTAVENDHAAWVSTITYAKGDRCISTVTHTIYESLAAGNVGHDPTKALGAVGSTVWWLEVGPTNRWAMFDGEVNTQTVVPSPLTVVLRPGYFNAFFLAGCDAETIEVTVKEFNTGELIKSYSGPLEASQPGDYYEYFFDRFKPQTDFLMSGIDPYNAAELTVKLESATGLVKCGILAVGDLRPLGQTQYGAKAKPKSFGYVDQDKWGRTKFMKGKAATDISATAWIKLSEANTVLQTIRDLLNVPCVLICTDLPEYAGLRGFGVISGEISYDHPKDCLLTVTQQGLI